MLIESTSYSALTPLLPGLVQELALTKSEAGVLFSAYMVGSFVGALLGVAVVRVLGARRAVIVTLLLVAGSTVGFALSDTLPAAGIFRALSGLGGGAAWVGAMTWLMALAGPDRRGEVVGTAMGVAYFGTLLGPLLGLAATIHGTLQMFALLAIVCLACAALLAKAPVPERPAASTAIGFNAGRARAFAFGVQGWTMTAIALCFGALFVLMPLRLAADGYSPTTIGWIFTASAALAAISTRVSGKLTDRVGPTPLTLTALLSGTCGLLVLAGHPPGGFTVAAVLGVMGVILTFGVAPTAAALSMEADQLGFGGATVSMIMLLVFAGGESLGGILAPALAERTTDAIALLALAATLLVSAALVWWSGRRDRVASTLTGRSSSRDEG